MIEGLTAVQWIWKRLLNNVLHFAICVESVQSIRRRKTSWNGETAGENSVMLEGALFIPKTTNGEAHFTH